MLAAKVIGSLWATIKNRKTEGLKLMLVKPYFSYNLPFNSDLLVAVDYTEAGPGDDVIIAFGQPGRELLKDLNTPVEAAIIGIIDQVEIDKKELDPENGLKLHGQKEFKTLKILEQD